MPKRALLLSFVLTGMLAIGSSVSAQDRVRIGLPVPNYGPYTPIYAADELGYFKKHGVTVEITSYRGSAALQEALVAGYVDLQVTSPNRAARAMAKGAKQKIVGVVTTGPTGWHIVVLKDSPIKTTKDLAGKKVGITSAGGLTHLYVTWATRAAGVAATAVPVGASGLIPALKSKQIDAASMHSPLPSSLLLSGEGRSIFNVARDMPPHMPDVWVATLEMIQTKPKVLERAMLAAYEAVAHLQSNKEKALELLAKHTGEKDQRVVEAEYEVIRGLPTSARFERKWLADALDLAEVKPGAEGVPALDELYTKQFEGISAK